MAETQERYKARNSEGTASRHPSTLRTSGGRRLCEEVGANVNWDARDTSQMDFAYRKTSALTSKPKDQRSIIADILLQTPWPLSFSQIVNEAKKARYEETLKHGTQVVTIKESIQWHLDEMVKSGTVKQEWE